MNLSILQGRLSSPDEGYQETPANWQSEFSVLSDVGLSHVEWVITKKQSSNNPFFNEDVRNYPISVVCADNVIDARIFERGFFFDNVYPICEMCQEYGIETVGIPLLEASAVTDGYKKHDITVNLSECCKEFKDLTINVEAELDADNLLDIVGSHKNLKITYDTGNMTAMNFDHALYIDKVFDRITNVHLKDRLSNYGSSRHFGKGDTNFDLIFKSLAMKNFDGFFTLQMARSTDGQELDHIKNLVSRFRRLHEQYF